jgi:hypothetical protein
MCAQLGIVRRRVACSDRKHVTHGSQGRGGLVCNLYSHGVNSKNVASIEQRENLSMHCDIKGGELSPTKSGLDLFFLNIPMKV